jgi:iron complex transport system permease protein
LARSLFEVELPLGIVTAIIGAPIFLYLLNRSRRGWN